MVILKAKFLLCADINSQIELKQSVASNVKVEETYNKHNSQDTNSNDFYQWMDTWL